MRVVGPAFPLSRSIDPITRYPTKLFSRPAPAFVVPNQVSVNLLKSSQLGDTAVLDGMFKAISSGLPLKTRQKQLTASFGFFEQAFRKLSKPLKTCSHKSQSCIFSCSSCRLSALSLVVFGGSEIDRFQEPESVSAL